MVGMGPLQFGSAGLSCFLPSGCSNGSILQTGCCGQAIASSWGAQGTCELNSIR